MVRPRSPGRVLTNCSVVDVPVVHNRVILRTTRFGADVSVLPGRRRSCCPFEGPGCGVPGGSELHSPPTGVLKFLPGRASGGMVDALASGASARKGVEVQLLSRARTRTLVSSEAGVSPSQVLRRDTRPEEPVASEPSCVSGVWGSGLIFGCRVVSTRAARPSRPGSTGFKGWLSAQRVSGLLSRRRAVGDGSVPTPPSAPADRVR